MSVPQEPIRQRAFMGATLAAEPSGPECPFCSDDIEVIDGRPGTVWGHCDRCRELVAVDVEFQL